MNKEESDRMDEATRAYRYSSMANPRQMRAREMLDGEGRTPYNHISPPPRRYVSQEDLLKQILDTLQRIERKMDDSQRI